MAIIGISGKIGSGKDLTGKIIQELCLGHDSEEIFNSIKIDAGTIEQREDSGWEIKKFADKLKDIVCILIGCTREQLEDQDFKNTELGEEWDRNYYTIEKDKTIYDDGEPSIKHTEKLTPRKLLQLLGTECGRDIIHPSIWVNALMNEYKGKQREYYSGNYSGKCKDCNENMFGIAKRQNTCVKCSSKVDYPSWCITDMRFPNEYDAVKAREGITIRVKRYKGQLIMTGTGAEETINITPKEHPSETALDNHNFDYVIDNNGSISDLIDKVREILIKKKII